MKITARFVIFAIAVVVLSGFGLTVWGIFALLLKWLAKTVVLNFIGYVTLMLASLFCSAVIWFCVCVGLLILAQPVFNARVEQEK